MIVEYPLRKIEYGKNLDYIFDTMWPYNSLLPMVSLQKQEKKKQRANNA